MLEVMKVLFDALSRRRWLQMSMSGEEVLTVLACRLLVPAA